MSFVKRLAGILLQANQKEAYVEMGKNRTFRLGSEMNILFESGFFPAFSFSKELLLILSLTLMAIGISQMLYCYIRIRQLNGKLSSK